MASIELHDTVAHAPDLGYASVNRQIGAGNGFAERNAEVRVMASGMEPFSGVVAEGRYAALYDSSAGHLAVDLPPGNVTTTDPEMGGECFKALAPSLPFSLHELSPGLTSHARIIPKKTCQWAAEVLTSGCKCGKCKQQGK